MTVPDTAQDELLLEFHAHAPVLHKERYVTFNTHQLTHFVNSVHQWGPLWAHPDYPFDHRDRRCIVFWSEKLDCIKKWKASTKILTRFHGVEYSKTISNYFINKKITHSTHFEKFQKPDTVNLPHLTSNTPGILHIAFVHCPRKIHIEWNKRPNANNMSNTLVVRCARSNCVNSESLMEAIVDIKHKRSDNVSPLLAMVNSIYYICGDTGKVVTTLRYLLPPDNVDHLDRLGKPR